MAGLYIHIPFCASRCIYCDFYSTTGRNRISFIDALLKEAKREKTAEHSAGIVDAFNTVYIGGGTPSQLTPAELKRLIDGLTEIFDLSHVVEFTMEANPEDITPEYVASLPPAINRISMGVQSFVDSELKMLNRRHNAQQPIRAVQLLKEHGIRNISIDLMYGLPNQTMESFDHSISQALQLDIQHISAYNLSVEEDTPLDKMVKGNRCTVADDELCNSMNALLRQKLKDGGFEQYEISNYSIVGYESKHNSSYWDGTPYLGLGPGAHSYNGNKLRWWNGHDLNEYLAGKDIQDEETLSDEDLYNECIMLGLRTRKGVNIHHLQDRHPSLYANTFLPALNKIDKEKICIESGYLKVAPQALHLTDAIIGEFFSI